MKFFFTFCLIVFSMNQVHCQFFFGGEMNLDVYKPYTDFGKAYIKNNEKVKSATNSQKVFYSYRVRENQTLAFGLSYMFKNLKVENYINGLSFTKYNNLGDPVDTLFYYSRFDLCVNSHSLGLYFDYSKSIISRKNSEGSIGISSNFYFFENAKGRIIDIDNLQESIDPQYIIYLPSIVGSVQNSRQGFFLSSINLSAYYRHVFQLHEKFSLAARASLGTNLYSDWDQFKKYAWVGLGLEMGFGKVKTWKHSKQKD